MGIVKPRFKPLLLRTYQSLNNRSSLTENDVSFFSNIEKGYEGEVKFDN
ncbi:MAG: hypothetical protein LRY71_10435 [Bacillaceae bacterium]|nr:hypothetical protein [Bacillaceae bacterium]